MNCRISIQKSSAMCAFFRSSQPSNSSQPEESDDFVDVDYDFTRDASSFIDVLNDDTILAPSAPPNRPPLHIASLCGTIFNFVNCIVGAGAIGLGGAMAASGGLISILAVVGVAILVKVSLDLVMELSIFHCTSSSAESASYPVSYEELGVAAYGSTGKFLVMICKFAYAFGCVLAYIVIIQDNFSPALCALFHLDDTDHHRHSFFLWKWLLWILTHKIWCTWTVSTLAILPLCMLRDMSYLAGTSFISIIAMLTIVTIVIYLWAIDIGHAPLDPMIYNATHVAPLLDLGDPVGLDSVRITSKAYNHWFVIHWLGLLNNMGTFVFSFVCQHTAHLTYASLPSDIRNLSTWKTVSTSSLTVSCMISLSVAIFCYMTFWEQTVSDVFKIYPDTPLIDLAKLLLCITMLFTFPLPFFTCREILIMMLFPFANVTSPLPRVEGSQRQNASNPRLIDAELFGDLNEPLLSVIDDEIVNNDQDDELGTLIAQRGEVENTAVTGDGYDDNDQSDLRHQSLQHSLSMDLSVLSARAIDVMNLALLPGEERQLKFMYHVGMTFKLWFVITALAIAAPNLGDVLDLVGCFSGTLIAFVLPGLFAIRLQGYRPVAVIILVLGGIVGSVGTLCSILKLSKDMIGTI
jgi:amino acid permease